MNYYCYTTSQSCSTIPTAEKITKVGTCLFVTGIASKSCEFCLYSCCYPNTRANQACKALWFPSCGECSNQSTANCIGLAIDWPLTIATFTGPLLWITGAVWNKLKKEENNQL